MTNKFPWVPVYDENGDSRLPAKSGDYLVTVKYEDEDDPEVGFMYYADETGEWIDEEGYEFDALDGPVTAWAIAPEPYEAAK